MGELLIGVLTGLVTSIVAWILTQTLLQPRVRFSRGISVVASANTPCGFRYRVKIQNVGLVRSALDLQARAVVTVRGLDPRRPNSWSSFKLEMSSSARPRIRPGGNMAWSIDPRSLTERGKELLRDLGFADVADNDNRTLEQLLDIRGPFREGQLRPEPAHLVVQALVNDGWTGKQFYKGSTEYFNNGIDLQQRRFKIGTSSRWRRHGERARGIHRALEFADKADDEA